MLVRFERLEQCGLKRLLNWDECTERDLRALAKHRTVEARPGAVAGHIHCEDGILHSAGNAAGQADRRKHARTRTLAEQPGVGATTMRRVWQRNGR
jgi:CTP:molybdopterin cytidylyltransferase MocA